MKKRIVWVVSLAAILFLAGVLTKAGQISTPATDQRFCADANGDGQLDISDAMTVLNFLFTSSSTPYCIAQRQSLPFATRTEVEQLRAELQLLSEQVSAAPRIYSGKYIGDGSPEQLIETKAPGAIRIVWISGRCPATTPLSCTNRWYFHYTYISTDMEPGFPAISDNHSRLEGPNFVVKERFNERDLEYVWTALVGP